MRVSIVMVWNMVSTLKHFVVVFVEDIDLDLDILTKGVRAPLEDPAKGFYMIAEAPCPEEPSSGLKFAGCLMIFKEWSDWKNGDYWWIASVQVERWCRRRGVGVIALWLFCMRYVWFTKLERYV